MKVVVSAPILSFYETIAGPTAPGSAPVAPAVTAALPVGSDESDAPAVLPSTYVDEGGRVHCLTADRTHKVILRCVCVCVASPSVSFSSACPF